MKKLFIILILSLFLNLNLLAQEATLISDINLGKEPLLISESHAFVGDLMIASGYTQDNGYEPYVINSLDGSVGVLKDIIPGSSSSQPSNFISLDGKVFFVASDGGESTIWETDGTELGTLELLSDSSCADLESISNLVAIDLGTSKLIAFAGSSPATGYELWFYELATGVCSVQDIVPGVTGSSVSGIEFVAETGFIGLMFTAYRGSDGREPWIAILLPSFFISRLVDLQTGLGASSSPSEMVYIPTGSKFLMEATNNSSLRRLHSITGIDTFTEITSSASSFYNLTRISSDKVVMGGYTAANGSELWITNGTSGGTTLVKDINPGTSGSNLSYHKILNNKVYFRANNGTNGSEPFVTDGTELGTFILADLNVGSKPSDPENFTPLGSKMFFEAKSSAEGSEIFKSDGTSAVIAADLENGISGSSADIIGASPTKILALADRGESGELYGITDSAVTFLGNTPGRSGRSSSPSEFKAIGSSGAVFFTADSVKYGLEPYTIDLNGNVSFIGDIIPGSNGLGDGSGVTLPNGKVIFSATTDATGDEPWVSDGTVAGTKLLKDIKLGTSSSSPNSFYVIGDQIIFTANDGINGAELWRTDGTESGTVLIQDLFPGVSSGVNGKAIKFDEKLYFYGRNAISGNELFRTDGFSIELVEDFAPGSDSFNLNYLAVNGDTLFIFGSIAGSSKLHTYNVGGNITEHPESPNGASSPIVSDSNVFFLGENVDTGLELFVWQDSAITFLKDINLGTDSSNIAEIQPIQNGRVVFEAFTPEFGKELWTSDGTSLNTQRITDINSGSDDSDLDILGTVENKAFFAVDSNTLGVELLTTDGTIAGTTIQDINPGDDSSNPEKGFSHYGIFYFSAYNNDTGQEPYRIVLDACFLDSNKTNPGVCGCGVIDQDANTNGVLDCLINPELLALINNYQVKLKKISVKKPLNLAQSKKLKKAKKAANVAKKAVIDYINVNNSSITKIDPTKFNKFFKQFKKFGKTAVSLPTKLSKAKANKAAKGLKQQILQ